jgi:hypothetical protein
MFALIIVGLHIGNWLMAELNIAWINAAILFACIALFASHLSNTVLKTFEREPGAKAYNVLFSGLYVFAALHCFYTTPSRLGIDAWSWTYPSLAIHTAIQSSTIGSALALFWNVSMIVYLSAGATALYGLYLMFADVMDLPSPAKWAGRNSPLPGETVYEINSKLVQKVTALTEANDQLQSKSTSLTYELEHLAQDCDRAKKRETALHQELVKASVAAERMERKLTEARHNILDGSSKLADLEKELAHQKSVADKQDAYIATLLERLNGVNAPPDIRDDSGYSTFTDNPFLELANRKTKGEPTPS